jgi:hypothetical protein
MSVVEGLWEETNLFIESIRSAPAQARMKKFMELGGQTREVELEVEDLVKALEGTDG